MKLEEVRAYILDDIYGIAPCTMAPVDTLIDSCFEYSILVNLLLVSKIYFVTSRGKVSLNRLQICQLQLHKKVDNLSKFAFQPFQFNPQMIHNLL